MQESKPLEAYKYNPGMVNPFRNSGFDLEKPVSFTFTILERNDFLSSWISPKWKLRKLDFWGWVDDNGVFHPLTIWGNMKLKYHNRGKHNRSLKVKYVKSDKWSFKY